MAVFRAHLAAEGLVFMGWGCWPTWAAQVGQHPHPIKTSPSAAKCARNTAIRRHTSPLSPNSPTHTTSTPESTITSPGPTDDRRNYEGTREKEQGISCGDSYEYRKPPALKRKPESSQQATGARQ